MKNLKKISIIKYGINMGLLLILVVYLYALLKIVLFKNGFISDVREVNLIPFEFLKMFSAKDASIDVALKNVVGNIAIFIPLGIFLTMRMARKKTSFLILLCAGVSVFFETIQFITGCGATDIDDIILNVAGGMVGILLYKVFLNKIDCKVKIPIASFIFLCVFGIMGRISLYLYQPNLLPADIEIINEDVISGIDKYNYDLDTVVLGVDDNNLVTTTDMTMNHIMEGKHVTLSENGKYSLTENANIILEERDYKYSPNGNIQKTTITYSNLSKDMLEKIIDKEGMSATIYFNDDGNCKTIILIKW